MSSQHTNSLDDFTILTCVPLDTSSLTLSTPINVGVGVNTSVDPVTVKPFVHLGDRSACTVMSSILERFHGITVSEGETAPSIGRMSPLDMSAWMRGDASLPHAELAKTLRKTRIVMLEPSSPSSIEYFLALASGPEDVQATLKAVLKGVADSFPLAMSCLYDLSKSTRTVDIDQLQSLKKEIDGTELQDFAQLMTSAQVSGRAAELAQIKKLELLQLNQDKDAYMATAHTANKLTESASARRDRMKEVFENYWPGLSMPSTAAELASFAADNKADSK